MNSYGNDDQYNHDQPLWLTQASSSPQWSSYNPNDTPNNSRGIVQNQNSKAQQQQQQQQQQQKKKKFWKQSNNGSSRKMIKHKQSSNITIPNNNSNQQEQNQRKKIWKTGTGKTTIGATSGAVIGGILLAPLGPFFVLGAALGGVTGGVVTNKVHKVGKKRKQRKQKQEFQTDFYNNAGV